MLRYLLKRLVLFIPTLIIISVITFFLSSIAPVDLAEKMLPNAESANYSSEEERAEAYRLLRHQLHLDLPFFYFSIAALDEDKNFSWKKLIPVIRWHGLGNQYHRWISGFIKGDFGISYRDKRPVSIVIWEAVKITLLISILSIVITYLIAIPLGVAAAVSRGKRADKMISAFLFALFSLPNFWVATLLIIFFGGGDYLDWFPAFGLSGTGEEAGFGERFFDTAHHLVLPLICLVYPNLAFLSFQTRGGMLNVLNQDYVKTARAKGLPESKVIWRHSFRNSLLPVITLFAKIFPMAIGGSVVVENIFSIPGMGKLTYESILAQDYAVVFSVMMLSAVMTMAGYLVADTLYAWIDPRIRFDRDKK